MPMATEGLKVLSRKSYEQHAVSDFDNPLSARYDENDALMFFDDVKVPWDRIFVHRDPDMCRRQFHDTPGHIYQNYHAQIRLTVKLNFLVGLAREVCETIGTVKLLLSRPIRQDGGAGSSGGEYDVGHGSQRQPVGQILNGSPCSHAAQTLPQEYYPMMIKRSASGGALIMLPSVINRRPRPSRMAAIAESVQVSQGRSAKEGLR